MRNRTRAEPGSVSAEETSSVQQALPDQCATRDYASDVSACLII